MYTNKFKYFKKLFATKKQKKTNTKTGILSKISTLGYIYKYKNFRKKQI